MIVQVDSAIRTFLEEGLPGVTVSLSSLSSMRAITGPSLNLFLYEVRPSANYNHKVGGFRHRDQAESSLVIDLSYLITAQGAVEEEHRILVDAANLIHNQPELTIPELGPEPIKLGMVSLPEPMTLTFWLALQAEPRPALFIRVTGVKAG